MHISELHITLQTIERRKKAANIEPCHTLRVADLFKELKKHPTKEIDDGLRHLFDEGRIQAGRTASDTWIKLR